MTNTLKNENVT